MSGFYVSSKAAVAITGLFVVIVVGVGLMAGLIPQRSTSYRELATTTITSTTTTTTTTQSPESEEPWLQSLLPDFVHPKHFDLWFYPDFYYDGNTFYGRETVHLEVKEKTDVIIIHVKMMEITGTAVRRENGETVELDRAFEYEPNQYWVVQMVEELEQGEVVLLDLNFTGSLTNGIVGYYKSTYINKDTGEESWLATTKFQPADARKAFPCFDEPRFKSTFTITLRHWQNFTALSNMPEWNADVIYEDELWRETKFPQTPIMSAYLTCFIVSDFNFTENVIDSPMKGSIPQRVWAAPDRVDQTRYSLEAGKNMSQFLEREFDMAFHLPKLDHVAVPDYPSGATEHWGLMTYREARLLYDPQQVGDYGKQQVASIVAHECLHSYFGNVITCYWWDEIWLNEAFASFYQGRLVDEFESSFGMESQLVANTIQSVMVTDAGGSSRPVVVPISDPDEANAAFDGITYAKGTAVLRMMEDFLGAETWRSAIQRYLKKHEYRSVTTQDLWNAVQEEIGEGNELDITRIMTPWVAQMGLPVVELSFDGTTVTATQRRFLNDPDADPTIPESPHGYKWEVPLSYLTDTDHTGSHWIPPEGTTFTLHDMGPDGWIKFNRRQAGYCRVNYWPEMWSRLSQQLVEDHSVFDDIERSSLLDDALSLARAGQLEYPFALDISRYLVNETEYAPWRTARRALGYIGDMLYGHTDYSLWRQFMRSMSSSIMDRLGVEDGGSHLDKIARASIISLACGNGHEGCLQNITQLFMAWVQDEIRGQVPTNLRDSVYAWGMYATGGDREFDVLWQRYQDATSGQEKDNILFALTRTRNIWLIQRLLDYSEETSYIRAQDFFTLINYISSNKNAIHYLWEWLREHYDELLERFGTQNRRFSWMVPGVVSSFSTEHKLQEVLAFYDKYPEAGPGERRRQESVDTIRNNIKWKARSEADIIVWLK